MTDTCTCPDEAGKTVCELPMQASPRPVSKVKPCPVCRETGKPVQTQTVKAMLSASLREVEDVEYLFCRTGTCPVVYYSSEDDRAFTIEQVREKVYQKHPGNEEVFICYCFRHRVGDVINAQSHDAILDDINTGIRLGQCACDIRNPQGSCCLGNVRSAIRQAEGSLLKPRINKVR